MEKSQVKTEVSVIASVLYMEFFYFFFMAYTLTCHLLFVKDSTSIPGFVSTVPGPVGGAFHQHYDPCGHVHLSVI